MTLIAEIDRPRFLADENFNGRIVAGLRRIYPEIDLLTFVEANIVKGLSDPELIEETAHLDRLLLTHDKRTMPDHFADVLAHVAFGASSAWGIAACANYGHWIGH